jgi:hypothetical protein
MDRYKNPIRRTLGVTGTTGKTGFPRTLVSYGDFILKVRKNLFNMFYLLKIKEVK